MSGAITLSICVALAWWHVLTGWGVNFPSQRPPAAFRAVAVAVLAGATALLAWYFLRG